MTDQKRARGRPRGPSKGLSQVSLRSWGPAIENLGIGERVLIEIEVDSVEQACRQVATALKNSPRFVGKTFSVKRMTALESRFGSDPVYLLAIERRT